MKIIEVLGRNLYKMLLIELLWNFYDFWNSLNVWLVYNPNFYKLIEFSSDDAIKIVDYENKWIEVFGNNWIFANNFIKIFFKEFNFEEKIYYLTF